MSGPTSPDDDWNDLARELGVDKSAPTPPPLPESRPADMVERQIEEEWVEPHHGTDPRVEEEVVAEGEPEESADEELEPGEGSPSDAAEPIGEGQSGAGRKRRRRRRRRRKGGAPEEAAPAGSEVAEAEGDEPTYAGDEAAEVSDDDAGFADEDAEAEVEPLSTEEDTASDVLRDLIANWNVPSWDDIVGGLYRPN